MTRSSRFSLRPTKVGDRARPHTTTMGSEHSLKSVNDGLPLAMQPVQPKNACRHRRFATAVGVFICAALWFVHKQYTFAPEPWLEAHPDHLGYHKSGSPTGREAEELFL